jgi:hypothetical protein
MKQTISKSNLVTTLGLILAIPTAYFIFISVLKYQFGINDPFDILQPSLERMEIKNAIGWNINLLILFGPVLAFLLTVLQVLRIKWEFTQQEFQFQFTIHKKWFPILVAAFSIGILAILFVYGFVENCNC